MNNNVIITLICACFAAPKPIEAHIPDLFRAIADIKPEIVTAQLKIQKLDAEEKQKALQLARTQVAKYTQLQNSPCTSIPDVTRWVAGGLLTSLGCWCLYRAYTTYTQICQAENKLDTIPGLDDNDIEPETPIAALKGTLSRQLFTLLQDIRVNKIQKKKAEIKATMPRALDYWVLAATGTLASGIGIKNIYSGVTCSDAQEKLGKAREILQLLERN